MSKERLKEINEQMDELTKKSDRKYNEMIKARKQIQGFSKEFEKLSLERASIIKSRRKSHEQHKSDI